MLAPIREALGKTEQQMQRIEKERAETFGSLQELARGGRRSASRRCSTRRARW